MQPPVKFWSTSWSLQTLTKFDLPENHNVAGGGVLRADDPGAAVARVRGGELVLVHIHRALQRHLRLAPVRPLRQVPPADRDAS